MKALLWVLAVTSLLAVGAAAQTSSRPPERFMIAQLPRVAVRVSTPSGQDHTVSVGGAAQPAWLQVLAEALRSITFWLTLLATALVAYIAAYLMAHSGYRPQAPHLAPRVARAALGWGMMLSMLLPVAAAWFQHWPWLWAGLLGAPFFCCGGLALLGNSR